MYRRPPKSIPSDTLFPYPNRFRSNEVLLAIVDHGFGAEAHAGGAFSRRACCRKDAGAEHAPKLDRRGADAARAAMDQKRFAAFQGGAFENIGPDGEEGFRQGCRLDGAETFGDGQGMALMSDAIGRIANAADQRADAVAAFPGRDAGAGSDHQM